MPRALTSDGRNGTLRATTLLITYLIVLVIAAAARGAAHHPRQPATPEFWIRDAICETGHNPPYWDWGKPGTGHGTPGGYEGGIGYYPSTWRWWAGKVGVLRRYPHAYMAPSWVQAKVAQYGLDHYGKWGCVFKLT